ncbi:nicotinate (nicotinamide) nucleotide adenylyltransferase [Pontibacter sp. G13]|uniref:nicotinate (nicotinamide) nucleotide adenylyltransferase n=1 Tax=Pontibacter sp. G13 TaxID=3074898 RepID=UPI002889F4BD|nr:nicotinate (nicotinamide) nucleotide adenylyltransferase [Pontibacter sp. G13]WNJ16207.1 nicotinate (nicotinamide) nucleotide adenylyltransferase [Pontibacter sp. G13]
MNVGLYFGSFNPIHTGHLILAQSAINSTELDQVWFVVSPQNPLKQKKNLIPEYDRLRMVEMAIEGNDRLLASNVEFSLPKPSYTIDTLTHLRDKYRSYQFSIIMGQDNLQYLHKWKNYEALLKHYLLFVYPRVECPPTEFDDHPHVKMFEAPLLNISATYIREQVKSGKSIRYMVPQDVEDYIFKEHLFR